MLSVPTLWIVFVVNFCALGLVWAYVARSYPTFHAARYWTASSLTAALGASISLMRGFTETLLPLLIGGGLLISACCLSMMGIRRFYSQPVSWRGNIVITGGCMAAMSYFLFWQDNMPMRIAIYSLGSALPIALTLKLLLSRLDGRINPGARLTAGIGVLIIGVYVFRSVAALTGLGGGVSMVDFNVLQAGLLVLLVFLSMAWNFGFLLMAIDRLRADVGDLALRDDLTGVANRRHLMQRLAAESTLAEEGGDVFAVLAIDLDGFKAINDQHGHAAGDACLRLFARAAQSRLRPRDMLARAGGDEFCVVLPATTQREGAMVARHILDACRGLTLPYAGATMGVSIGVAQWHGAIGADTERLIAAADQALYAAKSQGKNRYAIFDHAPRGLEPSLRQSA